MNSRSRQKGLSLAELLLALALGAVIVAGFGRMFAASRATQAMLEGQSRLQESARVALDLIARSARGAGYVGCDSSAAVANGLNGAWRDLPEVRLASPVEAFDGVGADSDDDAWQPSLAGLKATDGSGGLGTAPRPGTDVLVLRRMEARRPLARSVGPLDAVVVDADDLDLQDDDFALLADCARAMLFRITSIAEAAGVATLARTPGPGRLGNRAVALGTSSWGGASGAEGASVGRVVTDVYFVAEVGAGNNRGEPVFALWRKVGDASVAELLRGIDDMQLLLAVDSTPTDADRRADRYLSPANLGGEAVRAVHVELLASSIDAAAGDRPLRRVFARTVALRPQLLR